MLLEDSLKEKLLLKKKSDLLLKKTNRDLVTCIFPGLRQVTCVYSEFSLAPSEIFLCSDWPL